MEHGNAFLQNLALVLSVAAVTTIVFRWLRQPLVFGYLLAGMIVGPHLPIPLLADQEMLRQLAELGVVLLMFALGLEFSVRKLASLAPTSGLAALAETSVMLWIGFAIGKLMGWSGVESLYLGAIVSISSTTIIAKAYAERNIRGPVRPVVFGILVFEDLVAILLVAVLTAISGGDGLSVTSLGATAIRLVGFLAALIGIGLLLVPRLVRFVARIGENETLLVTSIGICFAAALLALAFGYSVALGAFIAGSLVGESGERTRIEHLVVPVRDVFVAIFFVAVGTLIDPRTIVEQWGLVLGLVALVTFGKMLVVSIAAFLTGSSSRTAVQAGMSLAQIGEFSFIIAAVGATTGATRPYLYPVAVAVSAITTFATPWLIRAAQPVALYVDRKLPKALQTYVTLYASWLERLREAAPQPERRRRQKRRYVRLLALDAALLVLIIVASSLEFERVSGMLMAWTGISPRLATAVVVLTAAAFAAPVLYGVMSTARFLARSLAMQALPLSQGNRVDMAAAPRRMLVATFQIGIVLLVIVPILALTQPVLPPLPGVLALTVVVGSLLVAFWRSARNLYGHARAGAEVIVGALSTQMANAEDVPEEMMQTMEVIRTALPGLGEPVPIRIWPGSPSVNRSLSEINLRGHTGATILAIGREGTPVIAPTGPEVLKAGDVLAIAGTHEAISAAIELLGGAQGAARLTVSTIPLTSGV